MKFLNHVYFLKKYLEKHEIFFRSEAPCAAMRTVIASDFFCPNLKTMLIDLNLIVAKNHDKKIRTGILNVISCVAYYISKGAN